MRNRKIKQLQFGKDYQGWAYKLTKTCFDEFVEKEEKPTEILYNTGKWVRVQFVEVKES